MDLALKFLDSKKTNENLYRRDFVYAKHNDTLKKYLIVQMMHYLRDLFWLTEEK